MQAESADGDQQSAMELQDQAVPKPLGHPALAWIALVGIALSGATIGELLYSLN